MPGETGAEQTSRVTVSNGLPALPAANPNEPLSNSVACLPVCDPLMGNLFPVLWNWNTLLQVDFSAVCPGALRYSEVLGMIFKTPELTYVVSDLSWCMKANLCSKAGFADGGNNPLVPEPWRKG